MAGLLIVVVLLVGVTALSVLSAHNVAAADRHTVAAERTLAHVNRMRATLRDTDAAALAYRARPGVERLAGYEKAHAQLVRELAALPALAQPGQPGAALLFDLHARAAAKAKLAAHSVAAATAAGQPQIDTGAEANASAQLATEIDELAQALQQLQFNHVAAASALAVARARTIQWLNWGLLAVALGLALAGAWFLVRRMPDLDGLITICAWTQRVRWQGRWLSFEDFLTKRFHFVCTHGICDEEAAKMRAEMLKEEPAGAWRAGSPP